MKDLDIIDRQLSMGQVKTIRSSGGRVVDYVELLFSPTTNCQFMLDTENNQMILSVKDVDLTLPSLECNMKKETIRDLIIGLKDMYNQLLNEEEQL